MTTAHCWFSTTTPSDGEGIPARNVGTRRKGKGNSQLGRSGAVTVVDLCSAHHNDLLDRIGANICLSLSQILSHCKSLAVFLSLGNGCKSDCAETLFYCFSDFIQRYVEELPPQIDHIHAARLEAFVECIFQTRRIFGVNDRMDIKMKWHRCPAKFIDSF